MSKALFFGSQVFIQLYGRNEESYVYFMQFVYYKEYIMYKIYMHVI